MPDWTNLGVAGAVLVILFVVLQAQDKRFGAVLERQDKLIGELLGVIKANTAAMTEVRDAVNQMKTMVQSVELRLVRGDEHFKRVNGQVAALEKQLEKASKKGE